MAGVMTATPVPSSVTEPSEERIEQIKKQLDDMLIEIDRMQEDIKRNQERGAAAAAETRVIMAQNERLLANLVK